MFYSLLTSVFVIAYNTIFRFGLVKVVAFFAISWLISEGFVLIKSLIATYDIAGISTLFNSLPNEIWYFLNLFAFSHGIKLIIGAFVARFIIRRLPVIG